MGGNGHIIPNTPIAVDLWSPTKHPEAKIFFLSHFHSDHIVGLTSSWSFPIYTSEITAKLLVGKLKINSTLIRELELNKDHLIPLDDEKKEMLTVRLINANHCPGSVMFLFSGYFGNVLYTGDFRYSSNLLEGITLPIIDILYLDNTYCSSSCEFYSREYAVQTLIQRLHNCLKKSDRIMIGIDNLGKEEVLLKIYEETECKIYVDDNLMKILEILEISHVATTNPKSTKLHAVPTVKINGTNLMKWNKCEITCAILPTARYTGLGFIPFSSYSNIHIIPYSNHSSFRELKEFVKKVHPRHIEPIIKKDAQGILGTDISSRANMDVFTEFIRVFAQKPITIPESVRKFMSKVISSSEQTERKLSRKRSIDKQRKGSESNSTQKSTKRGLKSLHVEQEDGSSGNVQENWELVCLTATEPPKIIVVDSLETE
ncbi:5' exonuclease Apollo-like isoform X1 [Centruroides vittatus]|uniref:5' exonuclease Apollo-like isoform X1 n=1 Tax=Centruroides vittatus TaxID=120091 RepID=UPI0035100420